MRFHSRFLNLITNWPVSWHNCEKDGIHFNATFLWYLENVHCRRLLLFFPIFFYFISLVLLMEIRQKSLLPVCSALSFGKLFTIQCFFALVRILPRLSEAIKMTFLHFMHTCLCECYFSIYSYSFYDTGETSLINNFHDHLLPRLTKYYYGHLMWLDIMYVT